MKNASVTSFPFAHPDNNEGGSRSSVRTDSAPSSKAANSAALHALKEELSKIPHCDKSCLVHAQRVQPSLVDDDHLMRFLQTENFDVRLALNRLLKYWENRYKVFGPEKFALPMTLTGAMRGSIPALRDGFLTLLPVLDEAGRAIMYTISSQGVNIPADQKIRVWWYLLHVAMENPNVREKGFIVLSNASESTINHFDTKYVLGTCHSGDQYFPIRWKTTHVCNARSVVWPFVASAVRAILSKEQRKSFVLHNGTNERILDSLSEYLLPKECVPSDMGGSLHLSMENFIQERHKIEGSTPTIDETPETTYAPYHEEQSKICVEETVFKEDCSAVGSVMNQNHVEAEHGETKTSIPVVSNAATVAIQGGQGPVAQKLPAQQKRTSSEPSNLSTKAKKPRTTAKAAKSKSSKGCVGDSRMHLAVKAKMGNQFLPLLAALEAGGFVFPGINDPGVNSNEAKDTDGVTFYQRRNQLLRRLRLAKEKAGKK